MIIVFLHQSNSTKIQILVNIIFKGSCLRQKTVIISFFIVYELDTWSRDWNSGFTSKDCLFGSVKLAKSADPDK